jgi:hypothetical protein
MSTNEPTPVVLLPNGNIAYKMPGWWREIGPDGKDYGNLPTLPTDAMPMVPVNPSAIIHAGDEEVMQWAERVVAPINEMLTALAKERAKSREMFDRVEKAEDALYDAQRGWRERLSDWWHGGGAI